MKISLSALSIIVTALTAASAQATAPALKLRSIACYAGTEEFSFNLKRDGTGFAKLCVDRSYYENVDYSYYVCNRYLYNEAIKGKADFVGQEQLRGAKAKGETVELELFGVEKVRYRAIGDGGDEGVEMNFHASVEIRRDGATQERDVSCHAILKPQN